MSAPLRRLLLAALSVLVLVGVSACGDDTSSTAGGSGGGTSVSRLDAVTVAGDVGTVPEVTWKSKMSASKVEVSTITAGDGPAIADDGSVLAQIWIGNGFSQEKSYTTYDDGSAQVLSAAGSIPAIADALKGATVGSRVAVTASADEAFGSETGNAQLGIGNKDSVLLILDLVAPVLDGPDGAQADAPGWMPAITETDGKPTAFDFTGVAEPADTARKATLYAGTGATVTSGQTVAVNYLGQVYQGDKPFDESYSKQPAAFQIGTGKVIKAWDRQVVGSKVGSRIVIEVPPRLGYGKTGQESAGIKGTDTLYFVIDILAAA